MRGIRKLLKTRFFIDEKGDVKQQAIEEVKCFEYHVKPEEKTKANQCCTKCKINFWIPADATDFNEYDIFCPLCGKVEHTLWQSLEWNKSMGR